MTEIKPYILVKDPDFFPFYHYLNIVGGAGTGKKGQGGAYRFYIFYAQPAMSEVRESCSPEFWCKKVGIPCGCGNSLEDAYQNFQEELKKLPLKNS